MNVLFSCDEYPPLCTGGIGTAVKIVAECLVARGHNVIVVSGWLPTHDLPFMSMTNGVTVYRLKYFQHLSYIYNNNNLFSKICRSVFSCIGLQTRMALKERDRTYTFINKLVQDYSIDLIELPDYTFLSKYYSHYKQVDNLKWSVPVIGRVHGSDSFQDYYMTGRISPIVKNNDKAFLESCNRILAVSRFSAKFINQVLGINEQVDVIYNPIDDSFIADIASVNDKRTKSIVFVGKLFPTKGAYNLIKAFNVFTKYHPDYNLVMIGSGNIDEARAYVSDEAKDKVLFTGFIERNKIRDYVDQAAFAVIPSFFETLGIAAIEIMGRGNILIYTNTSTGPEIINDGEDGFLVNPHDVDAIVARMLYVADNINALLPMRYKAVEKIRKLFSESCVIDELEKYYKKIIEDK